MEISLETQHFLVYLAVGFASYKLFSPLFFWLYRKYQKWKNPNLKENSFSYYTKTCSKCSLKDKS
jgi:hypothetical protein